MKNALTLIAKQTMPIGRRMRERDMPAAFIANNSLLSAKLPSVIIDESSVASGSESGNRVQAPHIMNSSMTFMLKPLPTNSSM